MFTAFTGKYRKAITIYLGLSSLLILFSVFGAIYIPQEKATSFIPLDNVYYEFTAVFVTIPFSATIGALIGGYMFTPVYLSLHRLLNPKMVYFIADSVDMGKFSQLFSGFYPALLAFNLNSLITQRYPLLLDSILSESSLGASDLMRYMAGNVVLMMLTIGMSMLFFSPVFFLNDGNIMYSSSEYVKETGKPVETRSVGGWFYGYLKGYSGLSVAFSYFFMVISYANRINMDFLFTLFWGGLPFFITISVIPAFIFLDKIKEHRTGFVKWYASRIGINLRAQFKRIDT